MVSEEEFVEKVLGKDQERCPECGSLKDAWGFCMTCFEERRKRRRENLQDDAAIFGDEFFTQILDWIELYMEPEDVFSEPTLNDWAARNGWVPENDDTLDTAIARANQGVVSLNEFIEDLGGTESDDHLVSCFGWLAKSLEAIVASIEEWSEEGQDGTE